MAEEWSSNCSDLCTGCCSLTPDLNQTNSSQRGRPYPYLCTCYDFVIEAVLMSALCLLGVVGNGVSMICLMADKSRTATPFLLISLEVTDTLFLAAVFPLRVLTSIDSFFDVEMPSLLAVIPYIGKYAYPMALVAETGTIYVTILVTVNRYISVCHPYRATNLCSVSIARRHVAAVALFAILINLPRFFEYEVVSSADGRVSLAKNWIVMSKVYKVLYSNLLYFVIMFLIPLVSLAILNTRLVAALRRTKTRRARLLKQPATEVSVSGGTSRSEDDITLMLIVVVMVFVVTQTPAMVTHFLLANLSDDTLDCPHAFFFYERLSDLFVVVNSSINFIIYCFCSRRFRQILLRLVTGKLRLSPNRSGVRITMVPGRATPQTGAAAIDNDVSQL